MQTMVVAPYASGSCPINIDVSKASQEEYMRLTTRNSVMATRTIAQEGNRVVPPPPSRRRTTISTVARPEPVGVTAGRGERRWPRSSDR